MQPEAHQINKVRGRQRRWGLGLNKIIRENVHGYGW